MIATIDDLVVFLKRFHRHWMDDPSLNPSLIPADAPPGLATIYRELGGLLAIEPTGDNSWSCPFARQDFLHPPDRLERNEGLITFLSENQAVWTARFPVGDPDPPVYCDAELAPPDEAAKGHVLVCESLNRLLITYSLQEAVLGSRRVVAVDSDGPIEEAITAPLTSLWLDGPYVYPGEPYDFFATHDGRAIIMHASDTIWIGSRDVDASAIVAPDAVRTVISP